VQFNGVCFCVLQGNDRVDTTEPAIFTSAKSLAHSGLAGTFPTFSLKTATRLAATQQDAEEEHQVQKQAHDAETKVQGLEKP